MGCGAQLAAQLAAQLYSFFISIRLVAVSFWRHPD